MITDGRYNLRRGGLDVEEPLLHADRLLVLDEGRIAEEIKADLGHPRSEDLPGFGDLRRRLLALLRVPAGPEKP